MTKEILIPIEFKRLFDSDWREAAVYGGRMSLKSHTVARILLIKARMKKTRIACFREFQNSIKDSSHQLLSDLIKLYDLTDFVVKDDSIINTINGSDFIFKGLRHNEQSIKSIEGVDIAWCEESQTISDISLEVLTPTIRKPGSQIIYTYNRLLEEDPIHKRLVLEGRPDTLIINVNYDIAEKYGFLPVEIKKEIEDDKLNRPALYKHKWLGEPINMEARIYKDWAIIDEIPHEAKLIKYGLDFGYSLDPTAIVAVYSYNSGYIVDEVLYRKEMLNSQIAGIFKALPFATVIADSAEPKSIDELKLHGVVVLPATKGAGSINQGIQFVQGQRISVTSKSVNILKEYRNYMWLTDKNSQLVQEPSGDDHSLDAIRYSIASIRGLPQKVAVNNFNKWKI